MKIAEEAERAYHLVIHSGTLDNLGEADQHESDIVEEHMTVSKDKEGALSSLKSVFPKLTVSNRYVTDKDRSFILNLIGPRSRVYKAKDFITEWTENMSLEMYHAVDMVEQKDCTEIQSSKHKNTAPKYSLS